MTVSFIAQARLPTRFGDFTVHAFRDAQGGEHLALVRGRLEGVADVRIHSKCLTGDTLTSLRCDCRDQLEAALVHLAREGGLLIYLDQEGRGIGLANKIRAYALQDEGHDTVEANRRLGFAEDLRDYSIASDILRHFGLQRIRLLTNNPRKIRSLKNAGIAIVERIPLQTPPTPHSRSYIETKKKKLHHLL